MPKHIKNSRHTLPFVITGVSEIEEFIKDVLPQNDINKVFKEDESIISTLNEYIDGLSI